MGLHGEVANFTVGLFHYGENLAAPFVTSVGNLTSHENLSVTSIEENIINTSEYVSENVKRSFIDAFGYPFMGNSSYAYDKDWNGTIPRDEYVTDGEEKFWNFLQIPKGSLCDLLGFEESPYYLLFAQIVVANLILELFKWVMPHIVDFIKQHVGPLPVLQPIWNGINSSASAVVSFANLCTAPIKKCMAGGQSRMYSLCSQNSAVETANDQEKGEHASDQAASSQEGATDGPPNITDQDVEHRDNRVKGEHYYFFWQATMATFSVAQIAGAIYNHSNTSWWAEYNFFVYAIFNSGAMLFIFQQVASSVVDRQDNDDGNTSGLKVQDVITVVKWLLSIPLFLAVFAYCVLLILTLFFLPWPSKIIFLTFMLPMPCLAYCYNGFLVDIARDLVSGVSFENQTPADKVKMTLAKSILVLLLAPIIWFVGVIVRMNAGELESGWVDPITNDFNARTWYTIAHCQVAKAQNGSSRFFRVLDLVQRWT